MRFRHVILDRDGTLNREPPSGWVTAPEEWSWEAGSLEALARLSTAGAQLSVATNQSCIGHGVATVEAVEAVHRRLIDDARAAGAAIDRVLVCPHTDADGCRCRKPAPGLVLRALAESGVAPEETILVGDAERDVEAGRAAGVRVALVRTGKGARAEQALGTRSPQAFDDLRAAAAWIVGADSVSG